MQIRKKEILIFLSCLTVWIAVQFIYSNFVGSLGDQDKYLFGGGGRNMGFLSNTYITVKVYEFIQIFLPGKFATLLPLTFTSVFLYRSIRIFYYQLARNEKIIVLLSFCLPHFWIWQSVASKEAILIPVGLIVVNYFSKSIFFDIQIKEKIYLSLALLMIFLLKIHLFPAYILLILSLFINKITILIKELRDYLIGTFNYMYFIWITLISSLSLIAISFFKTDLILYLEQIMLLTRVHLLQNPYANTSRFDLNWSNYLDFFNNMYWGIPASLIGLLPNEIEYKPIYFIFFMEGIFFIFLLMINQLRLIYLSKKILNIRFIYFFGILPATLYLILIHYTSGIFNAGTAIRYKQNILPIILYLPIYILGFYRLRKSQNIKRE